MQRIEIRSRDVRKKFTVMSIRTKNTYIDLLNR
jgi:hypothetical protein